MENATSPENLFAFRVLVDSLIFSNRRVAGENLINSLILSSAVETVENSTKCQALFGSEEYNSDPCCSLQGT